MILLVLLLMAPAVTGSDNGNVSHLKDKISKLENKVDNLKDRVNKLEKENSQLKNDLVRKDRRINELKNKVRSCDEWDARDTMRELYMLHNGKPRLFWHKGGYGYFVMFQYVGPWNGQYGDFDQYTQIARSKMNATKAVGEVVIKPEWGFNGSDTVRIKGRSDVRRIEKEYNSPHGLAVWAKSVMENRDEATRYLAGHTLFVMALFLVGGAWIGEKVRVFTKINRMISSFILTDMGGEMRYKLLTVMCIAVTIIGLVSYWVTQSSVATLVSVLIGSVIIYSILGRFIG